MTVTIAHLTKTFLPLTEGWIYDQLLSSHRYRHVVLARKIAHPDLYPWNDLHVTAGRWRRLAHDLAYIVGQDARLLHAHFGDRGVAALPLAKRSRLPLVTSFYGRDLSRSSGLRQLFSQGAAFLAEGPHAARRLRSLGAPADRVLIHRLGVDLSRFHFQERRVAAGETLRLLMIGRFVEKKGFVYALRAVAQLPGDLAVQLTVAGDAGPARREQRVKRELMRIMSESSLPDRVRFLGFVSPDRVQSLLMQHHVLLQPSVVASDGDSEGGHPVILTQAAATGMPVIATRHCDIPEVVVDRESGWLCDEKSAVQIAEAIVDAVRNPCLFATFGRRARQLIEEKYDIRTQTLDNVYDQILR